MRRIALIGLLLVVSTLAAAAQETVTPEAVPMGPAAGLPGGGFPVGGGFAVGPARGPMPGALGPAHTIMLDVRGLDIDHLLKLLGEAAGLTIVKDPAVTGPVTIICPRPVSIEEALEILNAVLEVRGFTAVRRGEVLKVTTLDRAIQMTREVNVGTDPEKIAPGDRVITQIVPLANLDAGRVAAELAPLAMSEASLIPNLSTNTLYITDTASNVQRLLGIINEMEKRNAAGVRVFRLQYVGAEEMAESVWGILGAAAGAPTAPYEQRLLPRRPVAPGTPARPGVVPTAAAGAGGPQVFTDARTNSLIVLANPERLELIGKLVAEFDRPVDYSSTLAVIPLEHARADAIADLLGQAFGAPPKAAPAVTPRTTPPTTTGLVPTRPRTSSGLSLQSGSGEEQEGVISVAGLAGEGAKVQLAQATEAPAVGRTQEGRVVPLVEAKDITVVADPSTNSLIINAPPEKLELVKAMIGKLDVVPTQVLIQAIIAEVGLSKRRQLGVEFSLTHENLFRSGAESTVSSNFGLQQTDAEGNPIPLSGLSWSVLKPERFSSLLNALATDSDVRILSTPRIFTTSGKKAAIDVSTQVPFATGQFVSQIGGGVSTTFEYQSVGIVLEVVPLISQDGTVTMEVSQRADDLLRFEALAPNLQLPVVSKRLAEATVSVQDGDTVVLGGLMSDRVTRTESGIPLLKDLPLIGWVFRSRDTRKEKTELLVFLTPQVVRAAEESRLLTEQQKEQLKNLPKVPSNPLGPEG